MNCSTSDASRGFRRLISGPNVNASVPCNSGTSLRQTVGAPGSRSGFRRRYRCLQTETTSVRVEAEGRRGGREAYTLRRVRREFNDLRDRVFRGNRWRGSSGGSTARYRFISTTAFLVDYNGKVCRLSVAPHRVTHPKNSALSSEGNRGGNAAHLLCCGSSLSLHG